MGHAHSTEPPTLIASRNGAVLFYNHALGVQSKVPLADSSSSSSYHNLLAAAASNNSGSEGMMSPRTALHHKQQQAAAAAAQARLPPPLVVQLPSTNTIVAVTDSYIYHIDACAKQVLCHFPFKSWQQQNHNSNNNNSTGGSVTDGRLLFALSDHEVCILADQQGAAADASSHTAVFWNFLETSQFFKVPDVDIIGAFAQLGGTAAANVNSQEEHVFLALNTSTHLLQLWEWKPKQQLKYSTRFVSGPNNERVFMLMHYYDYIGQLGGEATTPVSASTTSTYYNGKEAELYFVAVSPYTVTIIDSKLNVIKTILTQERINDAKVIETTTTMTSSSSNEQHETIPYIVVTCTENQVMFINGKTLATSTITLHRPPTPQSQQQPQALSNNNNNETTSASSNTIAASNMLQDISVKLEDAAVQVEAEEEAMSYTVSPLIIPINITNNLNNSGNSNNFYATIKNSNLVALHREHQLLLVNVAQKRICAEYYFPPNQEIKTMCKLPYDDEHLVIILEEKLKSKKSTKNNHEKLVEEPSHQDQGEQQPAASTTSIVVNLQIKKITSNLEDEGLLKIEQHKVWNSDGNVRTIQPFLVNVFVQE